VARLLLVLLLALPFLDLWVLLQIGRAVGFANAIALVLVTGLLGAWLAKSEGVRVTRAWQRALAEGRVPDEGVLSGALVLAGGLLLVTPGVISDALGLLLLFPPTRRAAAAGLGRWLRRQIEAGRIHVVSHGGFGPPPAPGEPIDVTPRGPDARRLPDRGDPAGR
jgi:UPF0716 protein FxsA